MGFKVYVQKAATAAFRKRTSNDRHDGAELSGLANEHEARVAACVKGKNEEIKTNKRNTWKKNSETARRGPEGPQARGLARNPSFPS